MNTEAQGHRVLTGFPCDIFRDIPPG